MARVRRWKGPTAATLPTLSRKIRREIHKNAKATASRHWRPTDSQPEPHWVEEWNGQIQASIAQLIAEFEVETVPVLQTIARFNNAAEVEQPGTVERTPESRRAHQRWKNYVDLSCAAIDAIVLYDQREEALMREIQAKVDLNRSGRGIFYSKLTEYHPRPSEVRDLGVTAQSMDAEFLADTTAPLERAQHTVQTARNKLRRERQPEAFESPADTVEPTSAIRGRNSQRGRRSAVERRVEEPGQVAGAPPGPDFDD